MKSKNKALSLLFVVCLVFSFRLQAQSTKHTFALSDSSFLLDGKPFQIISGEMHFARVPREAWRQRMKMAKAMGLNTIATYMFWNLHEPEKGKFDFSGNNDAAAFVKMAQEEGLWVILRPSPYACAEWEYGGYPYWLQNEPGLKVRSNEAQYAQEYKRYIMEVGKRLAPLQINHGGNILMVQVENEYGSYGNDKTYLENNRNVFMQAGFNGVLYTCDGTGDTKNGNIPELLPAINGQDDPQQVKTAITSNHNGKGPFYIAEWYPAWFDVWREAHHTVPYQHYINRLDAVLSAGMSINMYMFHGGTTRGFMNGANYDGSGALRPQTSSYDYDAPLDEAGNATEKFMQFRQIITKHLPNGVTLPPVPAPKPTITIPAIHFTQSQTIFSILSKPVTHITPLTFEDLDQAYGYVLYRTMLNSENSGLLKVDGLRDYGIVFINGKKAGTIDRTLKKDSLFIDVPKGKATLEILVENLGRINWGASILQNNKGIISPVFLADKPLKNWEMYKLPFNNIANIPFNFKKIPDPDAPVLRKGTFFLKKKGDTYLDMSFWGKGCVWVNGHSLGRYWHVGPQQTLYLPAEWLKVGANTITVLELIKPQQNILKGIDKPILNVLQKE